MTVFYAFCAAAIMACAVHMVLSRNLMRSLLGLALLSTGVNLALFTAGGFSSDQPPIIAAGAKALGVSADPLAQALILTAIVIGFALTVVLAAIVMRAWRATRSVDARDIDALDQPEPAAAEAEPPHG
ncbi:MAG TPA: sodium:proton antiporter [Croceibacterium sp.]|nr:sodium:proton antiporter [Croceibacterium sp.]